MKILISRRASLRNVATAGANTENFEIVGRLF